MPRTAKAEEPSPPNDAASSSARGASPSLVESAGSEDEESEPSDLDETSWVSRATALPPAAALRGRV